MFTEQDLQDALGPVIEHHVSKIITPNTVLAAHLRAWGVNPVGPAWHTAKRLLEDGASFAGAAQAAATGTRPAAGGESAEIDAPQNAASHDPRLSANLSPTSTDAPLAAATAHEDAETVEMHHEFPDACGEQPSLGRLPRRWGGPSPVPGTGSMAWFPKVFGPGDIDGKGASKLLGTPNVPLSTVLVRETAQNSWDARLGHRPVTFGLHLRTLQEAERLVLRDRVFTGAADGLALRAALDRPGLRVLEVADRGTKGLGGPLRNDVDPPLGTPTDYIDLVLNVGAPRDVHLGAGTYGFGKTISYRVSRTGTVLIWSRSREDGRVQDRLIGSAIGESFSMDGKRYTGRHWWGAVRDEGGRVEPWTDDDAAVIARSVFDSSYDGDETGTTLMILDPDLGGEGTDEDSQRLADAILWNLWPKLLPTTTGTQPMQIELYVEGRQLDLGDISDHPVLTGFAEALQMVRSAQEGTPYAPHYNTSVHEVHSYRPKALIGHMAFCRYPLPGPGYDSANRDTVSVAVPSSHVAWMRHDAELVVRYDQRPRLDSNVLQWAAVFKPLADKDDAFAAAEPPAHDDWVPASISDRQQKSLVNVGIRRTQEIITSELTPPPPSPTEEGGRRSAAALGDSLSKLVGATPGSRPQRSKTSRKTSSSRPRRPQAEVLKTQRGPIGDDGFRVISLLVGVQGSASSPVSVSADVGVATDGSRMHDDELVSVLGWATDMEGGQMLKEGPTFGPTDHHWLLVRAAAGAGIDVSLVCVSEGSQTHG